MNANTQDFTLVVNDRPLKGKNAAYRLRREKQIPAVVYGPSAKEGVSVALSYANFREVYNKAGKTSLIRLEATGDATKALNGFKVLISEMQIDAIRNEVIHVDLHELDLKKPIRVVVPLQYVGKAAGLAEGGILAVNVREVEIRVLPDRVPAHIDVDVTDLALGDSLHISQLEEKIGKTNYEFMYDSDVTLVGVQEPEDEVVAATTAAPAAVAGAAAGTAAPGTTAAPKAPAKK
ncbi:MAG TPA: 50S ribosomal protein L25 [Bdellovibrionota bacterium]|nr:50S ribosomal protein L25 [Bdellovibrionota bacterium]